MRSTGVRLYRRFSSSQKYVCFSCRVCFHRPFTNGKNRPCPECGKPMIYAGDAFRAPRRRNVKEWERVEKIIRSGIIFNHDGAFVTQAGREYRDTLPDPKYAMRKTNGKRIAIKGRIIWKTSRYTLPE